MQGITYNNYLDYHIHALLLNTSASKAIKRRQSIKNMMTACCFGHVCRGTPGTENFLRRQITAVNDKQ